MLLQLAAVSIPSLRDVLHTVPLTAADWGLIAAGSLVPVAVVELVKLVQRWQTSAPPLRVSANATTTSPHASSTA